MRAPLGRWEFSLEDKVLGAPTYANASSSPVLRQVDADCDILAMDYVWALPVGLLGSLDTGHFYITAQHKPLISGDPWTSYQSRVFTVSTLEKNNTVTPSNSMSPANITADDGATSQSPLPVALGVGLGVGLPALLAILGGLWWWRRKTAAPTAHNTQHTVVLPSSLHEIGQSRARHTAGWGGQGEARARSTRKAARGSVVR